MKAIPAAKQKKLDAIQTKLLDVYIQEADPDNWTTAEKVRAEVAAALQSGELSEEEAGEELKTRLRQIKGDRYWEKKNAGQTMSLLCGLNRYEMQLSADGDPEEDSAKEAKAIAAAEEKVAGRLSIARPRLVRSATG